MSEELGYMIVQDGDIYCGMPNGKPAFITQVEWMLMPVILANQKFVAYMFSEDAGYNLMDELEQKFGLKNLKLAKITIDLQNAQGF